MKHCGAEQKYRIYFIWFLVITAILMFLYEMLFVDHFIGYIDGEAYYSYLPEYFLKGNWDYFEKYPIGTAVCEFPFFLIAHLITFLTDPAQANGYTAVYDWAVGISGIVYYIVGTIILNRVLKILANHKCAFFVCFFLTAGTALPIFATKYASFSHIKTYMLSAALIYLMLLFEQGKDDFFHQFLLGLVAGLIVIIININVFVLLFYLLQGAGKRGMWRAHLKRVFSAKRLIPNLLGGLLMVVPQMILWKIATGSWICYSYEGEAFSYLTNPKIWEVFFSDAKGLLIFSPILIFGILGIFFMKRIGGGRYTAGIAAVFVAETYTTAAWWCWWLGGVYSIRSYIDIFPFLAVAMAAFFLWLKERWEESPKVGRIAVGSFYCAILVFFCLVNFAFLKGTQTGAVNETMAFWWELKEALRQMFVF